MCVCVCVCCESNVLRVSVCMYEGTGTCNSSINTDLLSKYFDALHSYHLVVFTLRNMFLVW